MRLAIFITHNMEEILVQWENFAGSLLPVAKGMSSLLLRDHAREILEAVVKDLSASQSYAEQDDKSKGLTKKLPGAPETAAETHGLLRAMSGFEIKQMASEYRALRASVLKLWLATCGPTPHLDDIIRFNEAIDQALAESIDFFTSKVEERRNLFMGMLGHDLRTPLQAIQMTALVLERIAGGEKVSSAAKRLIANGSRMKALLNELIVFNNIDVGLGVRVSPSPQDMSILFQDELEHLRDAYEGQKLDLLISGPTKGVWDGVNLRRVLGNLVANAIEFGEKSSPISVHIKGHPDQITFEVRNISNTSDAMNLQGLFSSQNELGNLTTRSESRFGLGLFIAEQVVKAHGGRISARREDEQTVFAVQLPIDSTTKLAHPRAPGKL